MATIAVVDTDFDGLTCGWLFKKFIPDVMLLSWWGRDLSDVKSFDSKISAGDFVYFADKCPKPAYMKGLLDKGVNFRVLDHHSTSRDEIAKYDATNGTNLMSRCIFETGKKMTDPNTGKELERTMDAALVLVWNFLTNNYPLPPALKYLSAFDTFRFWSAKDADKLRAEWGSQVYSKNAEGKFSTGENINKILSKYLDIKMQETPGDTIVNQDGIALNKVDFESIDLNTDNFVEKAKEDFDSGNKKFEENRNMCKEIASQLLVLNLGGIDVLTVDITTKPELQGKRSDIGGYVASLSPEGVAGIIMTEKDPSIMKISMRVRGLTGDDDMPQHSVAKIANQYYYVTRDKKTGELILDSSGQPQKSYGGGHDEAAGIMVNVKEEDRVYPDQVLFSDIMSKSRQATESDIVCNIDTIKSASRLLNGFVRISSRDAVEDVAKYWDKASKEFGNYYRQLKKKKKKASISLRDLTKIANDGEHEWNCLMIDYPEDMASKIIAWGEKNIDEDNLYIDKEDPSYGREKHIHTTISYGIKPDIDFEKIKDECNLKPLNVSLGEVSKFDTDDKFDVIKITVEGSDLHDLHKKIEDEIGCPGNTYPDYKPHLTIAYVKKGSCDNLLGSAPFKGEKFILNNYDYSQAGKENKHIKHTANYIPNPKSTMPSPIKKNYDYGEIPNWIDRVEYETKKRQKARNKRKAAINSILK
jgi:hypothetical protein